MRARMALRVAQIQCQIVEIDLRNKPAHLVRVSPKATVPVLCVNEAEVIDESLDIMRWALEQHDPFDWLSGCEAPAAQQLLAQNDSVFKKALDQYKYSSRFAQIDPREPRAQAVAALIEPLATILQTQPYIGGRKPVLQDVAIFPFVRQFANVEPAWFESTAPAGVRTWLEHWLESDLFAAIMQKQT
jgi:glutathione S-transferase